MDSYPKLFLVWPNQPNLLFVMPLHLIYSNSLINNFRFHWGDHTGCMVPVFAYGPGAERFSGIQQNTDIPNKIRALMGW